MVGAANRVFEIGSTEGVVIIYFQVIAESFTRCSSHRIAVLFRFGVGSSKIRH